MSSYIIAEAGVNHNGDIALAQKLVDAAKASGADAVKFQTFKAESLVTKVAPKAQYQSENMQDTVTSQFEMLKKLELTEAQFIHLSEYSKKVGIEFLSTPFDLASVDFLEPLVSKYKISSCDCNNHVLLKYAAQKGKPMIVSTGMADLNEVREMVAVLRPLCRDLTLLHCTTNYPCPMIDVNLRAMHTLRDTFGINVGFSDHTEGVEVSVAAVALGASVIEKHFTLDRSLPGPDHKASLNPDELKVMVKSIRNVEDAMGTGIKEPTDAERKIMQAARRSIVAAADLPRGTVLKEEDVDFKRPGLGISPNQIYSVVGKRLTESLVKDQMVTFNILEDV